MTATLEPTTAGSGAKPAAGASPADVVRKAKEAGVQVVDFRFTDLPGTWQHFSVPLKELTEELFKEGIGFDGSSIRVFQAITRATCCCSRTPRVRSWMRVWRCRRCRSPVTLRTP